MSYNPTSCPAQAGFFIASACKPTKGTAMRCHLLQQELSRGDCLQPIAIELSSVSQSFNR